MPGTPARTRQRQPPLFHLEPRVRRSAISPSQQDSDSSSWTHFLLSHSGHGALRTPGGPSCPPPPVWPGRQMHAESRQGLGVIPPGGRAPCAQGHRHGVWSCAKPGPAPHTGQGDDHFPDLAGWSPAPWVCMDHRVTCPGPSAGVGTQLCPFQPRGLWPSCAPLSASVSLSAK